MTDLRFEGDVQDWLRQRLTESLRKGLTDTGVLVLSDAQVQERRSGSPGVCPDNDCRKQQAARLGCQYLAGGLVKGEDRSYLFKLWIARGSDGELINIEERCEICGQEKVAERMELLASALRAKVASEANSPGRLHLVSTPAGARVEVEGKPRGQTPLTLELPPGPHRIRLTAEGHLPLDLKLVAVSGVEERRSLSLVPAEQPMNLAPLGWAGVSAGVAGLAAGIVLMVLDGQEADCSSDPVTVGSIAGPCPSRYETVVAGGVLFSVGTAALAAGGYLLYRSYSGTGDGDGATEKASVRLRGQGMGFALEGAF